MNSEKIQFIEFTAYLQNKIVGLAVNDQAKAGPRKIAN